MEKIKLIYRYDGALAEICLNDGKGNVLDNAMMLELLGVFQELKQKKDVKMLTFQGEGKHFSFGASVEEHTKECAEMMIRTFHKIFMEIVDLKIPAMAKVSGQCLGGGMELALICNFIFADETACFGQPEITLGVFPPPASVLLPLKIGYARAEELLLTGRTVKANEACELGFVNHVFQDRAALNQGTDEWFEKYILPKSASSLRFAVKASRIKFNHILGNFLPQLEFLYTKQLMETNDANEGITSFLEKREPEWMNC